MDGLELSAIVHDEFPETKIIIFSAYGEFEYAKKAMEAKAVTPTWIWACSPSTALPRVLVG